MSYRPVSVGIGLLRVEADGLVIVLHGPLELAKASRKVPKLEPLLLVMHPTLQKGGLATNESPIDSTRGFHILGGSIKGKGDLKLPTEVLVLVPIRRVPCRQFRGLM